MVGVTAMKHYGSNAIGAEGSPLIISPLLEFYNTTLLLCARDRAAGVSFFIINFWADRLSKTQCGGRPWTVAQKRGIGVCSMIPIVFRQKTIGYLGAKSLFNLQ